jgi:mannitol-1-/sugar-/sorbitol-6-phosphatase
MRILCHAVLFDLDGVLVDSRTIVERTWRRWATRHGVDPELLLEVAHGRRTQETLLEVVPHLATTEELAWLEAAELADEDGLVQVPGAARLLATLRTVPWAVVTSAGPELARRRLAAAGLPLPPVLVSSSDVIHGKPMPDGYLAAAERLAVAPAEAVVFEDAPAGIAAGLAAGSTVIAVASTHSAAQLEGASLVVPDLTPISVEPYGDRWRVLGD